MKKLALSLLLTAIALPAFAQTAPAPAAIPPSVEHQMQNLNQAIPPQEQAEIMQKLLQNAGTIQLCLNEIGGPNALTDLQQRGEAVQKKVQELCQAGKFDEAQNLALSEGRSIASDARVVKLKTCAKDVLDSIPQLKELSNPDVALAKHHVCNESKPKAEGAVQ